MTDDGLDKSSSRVGFHWFPVRFSGLWTGEEQDTHVLRIRFVWIDGGYGYSRNFAKGRGQTVFSTNFLGLKTKLCQPCVLKNEV